LALSKAISRQDRGGGDFGFAVERHFATARLQTARRSNNSPAV